MTDAIVVIGNAGSEDNWVRRKFFENMTSEERAVRRIQSLENLSLAHPELFPGLDTAAKEAAAKAMASPPHYERLIQGRWPKLEAKA